MTKSNLLWLGALGVLVAALAIDRHHTNSQLKDLRHKYDLATVGATDRGSSENEPVRESPVWQPAADIASAPRAVASTPSDQRPATPDAPPTSAGGDPPSPSDHAAHIDTVFAAQSVDSTWSRTAESKLSSALLSLAGGGVHLGRVACRSTLCKVSVEHSSSEGIREFLDHAFTERNYWEGAMVTMRDPTNWRDTFANVIYFSKEGHDIPFLEN